MARTKDSSAETQSEKVPFNCTKSFKEQLKALAEIDHKPVNVIVQDAVQAVIDARKNEIRQALKFKDEYDQNIAALAAHTSN